MNAESVDRPDPRRYLWVLWRWKLLFLAFVIVIPVAALALKKEPPVAYQASTLLQVQPLTVDTSLFEVQVPSSPEQNILATARLIRTTGVADAAAGRLRPPPPDPRALLGEISVSTDTQAGFIAITARDGVARRAAAVANAFASAIAANRKRAAVDRLDRTIAGVRRQLDALQASDRVGRNQLSQQLQRLRTLRAAQGGNATVIEPAVPPSGPIANSSNRTLGLSIIIAILLGVGAVILAEMADRRIRTPEALEELTGLALLAAIPPSAFSGGVTSTHRDDEAFQMLRGALTYFNVDRRLRSVVITSPGPKEGKTTVATRLALVVARAGKRVVLVDADLRRPQAAARLGIDATDGLGALLVGERTLSEVLIECPVEGAGEGRLQVLPAGAVPPNPSELLSSQQMQRLLSELEEQSDLVVIDTAAALAVSDALPLLQAASGTVLVARMNASAKDAVRRLQRVIATADGTLLGTVATAARSGDIYHAYPAAYYATPNGDGAAGTPGRRWARARQGAGSDEP